MAINTNCLLQDGTVFIGLTSLPIGNESIYTQSIKELFSLRKKELIGKTQLRPLSSESKNYLDILDSKLYKPSVYYLFGKFDLAVMSAVDGFNFPVRQFNYHSFQSVLMDDSVLPFNRHTILGPTPKIGDESLPKIFESKQHFGQKRFPLITISRLKLNDLHLFDNGVEFMRGVIKVINERLQKKKDPLKTKNSQDKLFDFLIIENYGWSEITLVIFSRSFSLSHGLIRDFVRSITKEELITELQAIDPTLQKILVKGTSLAVRRFDKASVFIDTQSIYGFDFEHYSKSPEEFNKSIDPKDSTYPVFQWTVEPGCYKAFISALNKVLEGFGVDMITTKTLAGKFDLISQFTDREVLTSELIELIWKIRSDKSITKNLNEISTSITLSIEAGQIQDTQPLDKVYLDELKKLTFEKEDIARLKNTLNKLLVPHTTTEALLNAFATFNNHVSDPLSYSSFIELRGFLAFILHHIDTQLEEFERSHVETYQPDTFILELNHCLNGFHYAYNNRLLGSYAVGEQYDDLAFLTVGVQSLISAYDSLYKCLARLLGNKLSFVFVETNHEFTTSDFALRLNYFHMFNPELLCSVIFQEVANQCRYKYSLDNPSLFLFHRRSDQDQDTEFIDTVLRQFKITNYDLKGIRGTLVEICTPEYFEHIFSDIVGYKLFYDNDPELFIYWSWGYFATDPKHFTVNKFGTNEINVEKFIAYFLRQLLVLKVCAKEKYDDYRIKFDPMINALVKKHKSLIMDFINRFFEEGLLDDWLNLILSFASKLNEKISEETQEDGSFNEVEMKADLIAGRVVVFKSHATNTNAFQFCRSLLLAYLKAIKDESDSDDKDRILKRNSAAKKSYARLLFDPRGGTYIIDPELRRHIYSIRSAFHMSLIDLSLREKGRTYKEICT